MSDAQATTTLYFELTYNPAVTDPEALAAAFDQLLETALSTPDILSEYGSVEIGPVYCTGKTATQYVGLIHILDPDTDAPVMLEIRKAAGGYLVGIDASYLEQDVGPVYDPCNFGHELEIPADEI